MGTPMKIFSHGIGGATEWCVHLVVPSLMWGEPKCEWVVIPGRVQNSGALVGEQSRRLGAK